eukprot:2603311-Alexandrium_andersonii.AAC.2
MLLDDLAVPQQAIVTYAIPTQFLFIWRPTMGLIILPLAAPMTEGNKDAPHVIAAAGQAVEGLPT